jgi:hypothetical protein
MVVPEAQCEGELREGALSMSNVQTTDGQLREMSAGDAPLMGGQSSTLPQPLGNKDSVSHKRKRITDEGEDSLRKTCGIKKDYCRLNDPFSEDKNVDQMFTV